MTSPWKSTMLVPPADNQHCLCRRLPYFDKPWPAVYTVAHGNWKPDFKDSPTVPTWAVHSWRPHP